MGKTEEAQLILDLKKELGFKDKYFEKKIDYLLGYTSKIDDSISEKSIFDFHLAHKTNPNFEFEPTKKLPKLFGNIYHQQICYLLLKKLILQKLIRFQILKKLYIIRIIQKKNYLKFI